MNDSGPMPGSSRLTNPGVRFPPPFLFAAGFLAGLALERWVVRLSAPEGSLAQLFAVGGLIVLASGLALVGWGLLLFFRARTGIIPVHPASRLVTSGPYRFSRNPMYVGLSSLYLGLALVFNVFWPLVLFPIVLAALIHLVIRREELYLSDAFGNEYADYCRRVRRWI